jgi:hypothetical protein
MDRNEVYNLLMNFAEGIGADTSIAKQVLGVGKAIKILNNNIQATAQGEQRRKYERLINKINEEYVAWN